MSWQCALLVAALLAGPAPALAQEVRASALLGAAVDKPDGENIGYVTDLAIDLASRRVAYAMVRVAGNTTRSAQVYGVPLAALRPALQSGHLVLERAAAGNPSPPPDAQLVRASRLIGGDLADLVVDLDSAAVRHVLVSAPGGERAAALETLDPAMELRGTILDRGLVRTPQGVRQTAKLATPDGRVLALDLGAPGGEGTIAEGESVVLAAHSGELLGKPVYVVDVILQRGAKRQPDR
jgi:sporulation protein YlmC with PRC-barrel domain